MPSVVLAPMTPLYRIPDLQTASGRSRRRRLIALVVLLLLIVLAVYAGATARAVWQETMRAKDELNQGLALLSAGQLTAQTPERLAIASDDFARAEQSFAQARHDYGFWADLVRDHGTLLPGPAADIRSVALLLDLGRQTAATAHVLSGGLLPVSRVLQNPTTGGGQTDRLVQLTTALQAAQPVFRLAERQFSVARSMRRQLVGMRLVPGAGPLLDTFDRRSPSLSNALTYARALPKMLGADGPRSYLLVYQDTADLRANGGFIGSASLLTLDHGRLSQIDYETTGQEIGPNLQLPGDRTGPAPLPLLFYRNLGTFQLRDANFWPDFPTSALRIADLFRRATGRHIDGVLAATPSAIAHLLRVTGPVQVPGFPDRVTATNAASRLEYYVHDRAGANGDPHRKRFLVALSHAVLDTLVHAGSNRLSAVVPAIHDAFADRSLQLSVNDPLFAHGLQQLHWDGALRQDPGDYLAVFDQNATDSKLNPFVDQRVDYSATRRADGGLDSTVRITYTNRTAQTSVWIARTYYEDYLRVAVPGGSRLREQGGYDETFWPDEVERGRHLLAGGVLIPAGASRTVSLTYSEPPSVLANLVGYRLLVQKQPGSRPAALSVQVRAGDRSWSADTWLTHDITFSSPWDAPSGGLRIQSTGGL